MRTVNGARNQNTPPLSKTLRSFVFYKNQILSDIASFSLILDRMIERTLLFLSAEGISKDQSYLFMVALLQRFREYFTYCILPMLVYPDMYSSWLLCSLSYDLSIHWVIKAIGLVGPSVSMYRCIVSIKKHLLRFTFYSNDGRFVI